MVSRTGDSKIQRTVRTYFIDSNLLRFDFWDLIIIYVDLVLSVPTISVNISQREFDAIQEYANVCGEILLNCMRKLMIIQITFMDCVKDY
jgi:hypothetical protein